jgi:predicted transcriptional regulator
MRTKPNRNKYEIELAILQVINDCEGIMYTRLISKSNTSHKM